MYPKIIQIIPAQANVYSIYADIDGDGNEDEPFRFPVPCIALVEDQNGNRSVRYMDVDDDCVFDFINTDSSKFRGLEFRR